MSDDWAPDQGHLNAVELAGQADMKSERIACPNCRAAHRQARTLVKFYESAEDVSGEIRVWVHISGWKRDGIAVPPSATLLADRRGDTAWNLPTQCGGCRSVWIVFPGGASEASLHAMEGQTVMFTHRPDTSYREQYRVGDLYVAGTVTGQRVQGYRGVWLARLGTSTWGEIVH